MSVFSVYSSRGLLLLKSACLALQGSHRLEPQREEDSRKWEGSADRKQDVCSNRVTHTLQSSENVSVKIDYRLVIGHDPQDQMKT